MISALIRATLQLTDPPVRRVIGLSILATLAAFAGLAVGVSLLLHLLHLTGIGWLDWTVDLLGGVGTLGLAWLLFPAVVPAVSGLFLDDIVVAVERRHYPDRASASAQPFGPMVVGALRFLAVSAALNLLVLPLYQLPGANLVLFLGLNGYLLGREYYEQVAGRHLGFAVLTRQRHRHRGLLMAAGVVICGLAAIPLVNLLVPVIATAFMVHIFHRLPVPAGGSAG
ncbi:MAG: EI24 domain-containing protein [Rhodospirillaceae bacterium]